MIFVVSTYLIFLTFIVIWQIALILGAPLGEYTMGGQNKGELPKKKKYFAVVSICLLIFYAFNVLSQTDVYFQKWRNVTNVTVWLVVLLNALTLLGNTITKSKKERNLWFPITLIMFICILIIAAQKYII